MAPYTIVSLQVGRARTYPEGGPRGGSWRSAIDKQPVPGAVPLGREGLAGDAQADRRFHGGPERALLAYCVDHYPAWREELGRRDLGPGSFGENLSAQGLPETEACVGDTFQLGEALVQVSQPRVPCVKLARRLAWPEAVARCYATCRTGFYLRVLREGTVQPGAFTLVDRPFPRLTVALATRLLVQPLADKAAMNGLRSCPVLSEEYRTALGRAEARALKEAS